MKPKSTQKPTFKKLYLVEPDVYKKVLDCVENEFEKREIINTNNNINQKINENNQPNNQSMSLNQSENISLSALNDKSAFTKPDDLIINGGNTFSNPANISNKNVTQMGTTLNAIYTTTLSIDDNVKKLLKKQIEAPEIQNKSIFEDEIPTNITPPPRASTPIPPRASTPIPIDDNECHICGKKFKTKWTKKGHLQKIHKFKKSPTKKTKPKMKPKTKKRKRPPNDVIPRKSKRLNKNEKSFKSYEDYDVSKIY